MLPPTMVAECSCGPYHTLKNSMLMSVFFFSAAFYALEPIGTQDIARIRSYSVPGQPDASMTIDEGVMATLAGTCFDPASKHGRRLERDAIRQETMSRETLRAASEMLCSQNTSLKPLVKCLVAAGTTISGTQA
jgi:hypothetical protein